jgi:hypothetical protein
MANAVNSYPHAKKIQYHLGLSHHDQIESYAHVTKDVQSPIFVNENLDQIDQVNFIQYRKLDLEIPVTSANSTGGVYIIDTGATKILATLFSLFIFGILVFRQWDSWDHDYIIYVVRDEKINKLYQQPEQSEFARDRTLSKKIFPVKNITKGSHRRRSLHETLNKAKSIRSDPTAYKESTNAFLDDVMLSKYLLDDGDFFTMVYHSISHHHQYLSGTLLSPFFGYSLRETRTIRWINVGFTLLAAIFVGALFFQRFFPDDGFCESHLTLQACERPYTRVSRDNTCEWILAKLNDGSYEYGCHLKPPPQTPLFTIILAGITIILTLPLKLFNEFIMDEYCSKRPNLEVLGLSSEYWLGSSTRRQNVSGMPTSNAKTEAREHVMDVDSNAAIAYYRSKAKQRLSDFKGISDARFHGQKAFLTYLAPEEEVMLLLAEVKQFLTTSYPHGYVPSIDGTKSIEINKYRILLQTIADRLHVDPYGMVFPLTLRQKLRYGNHWHFLESKIIRARKKADVIYREVKYFSDNEKDLISKYLIQQFILEQLPFFRRYCMSKNFFQYDDVSPDTIDPFIWLLAWLIVCGMMAFFMFWVGRWSKRISKLIIKSWGINFAIGVLLDVFFVQLLKIYILNILVVSASKPQLKRIHSVLKAAAYRLLHENDDFDLDYAVGMGRQLRVIQHLSGACRVSRYNRLANLFAARVLRTIDDVDIENCKDTQPVSLPTIVIVFIIIPGLVGTIVGDYFSKFVFDSVFISWSSGFLLANAYLLKISPLLLMTPYLIVLLLIIWKLGILQPLIHRHRRNIRKRIHRNVQKEVSWQTRVLDAMAMIIYVVLYPLLAERRFIREENELEWKSVNKAREVDVLYTGNNRDSIESSRTFYFTHADPIPRPIKELLPHKDCANIKPPNPHDKIVYEWFNKKVDTRWYVEEIEMKYLGVNPTIFPNSCSQLMAQSFRDSHVTFDVFEAMRRLSTAIQDYQEKYSDLEVNELGSIHFRPKLATSMAKDRPERSFNYLETVDFTANGYDGYHLPEMYCLALDGVKGHGIPTVTGIWDSFYPSGRALSAEERREILDAFVVEMESVHAEGIYFSMFQRWFLHKVSLIIKLRQFDAAPTRFVHKRLLVDEVTGETRLLYGDSVIRKSVMTPSVLTRGSRSRKISTDSPTRRTSSDASETLEIDAEFTFDDSYVDDTALSLDKYRIFFERAQVDDEINRLLYASIKDIIRYLSKCGVLQSDHTCCTFNLQDIQIIFQFFAEQVINADMDELEALRDELSDWVNDNSSYLAFQSISRSYRGAVRDSTISVSDFIHWLREKLDSYASPDHGKLPASNLDDQYRYDHSLSYGNIYPDPNAILVSGSKESPPLDSDKEKAKFGVEIVASNDTANYKLALLNYAHTMTNEEFHRKFLNLLESCITKLIMMGRIETLVEVSEMHLHYFDHDQYQVIFKHFIGEHLNISVDSHPHYHDELITWMKQRPLKRSSIVESSQSHIQVSTFSIWLLQFCHTVKDSDDLCATMLSPAVLNVRSFSSDSIDHEGKMDFGFREQFFLTKSSTALAKAFRFKGIKSPDKKPKKTIRFHNQISVSS